MTTKELSKLTGMGGRQIRRWANSGLIPDARTAQGKHPHFPNTSRLKRWINESQWRISKGAARANKSKFPDRARPGETKRTKPHFANRVSPIEQFYQRAGILRQALEKIEVSRPISDWTREESAELLRRLAWLEDKIKIAHALLNKPDTTPPISAT